MSKTYFAIVVTLSLAAAAPLSAQEPPEPGTMPPADTRMESDLYLYLQAMERYEEPRQAVRRKAEEKSAQRRDRLASMKWYGYSPSRPTTNYVPWTSSYGQHWVGNGPNPYSWYGTTQVPVVRVVPDSWLR